MSCIYTSPAYVGPQSCYDQEEVQDALLHRGHEYPLSLIRLEMEVLARRFHDDVQLVLEAIDFPVLRTSFRPKSRASMYEKHVQGRIEEKPLHDLYGARIVVAPDDSDVAIAVLCARWPHHVLRRGPSKYSVNGFAFPRLQVLIDMRQRIGEIQILTPELEVQSEATRGAYEVQRTSEVHDPIPSGALENVGEAAV